MIFVARGRGSNVPARADASKNPVERMHHQLFREESLAYAWVSSMSAWPDFMRLETVPDERDDSPVNLPRKNGDLPRKKWGALDLGQRLRASARDAHPLREPAREQLRGLRHHLRENFSRGPLLGQQPGRLPRSVHQELVSSRLFDRVLEVADQRALRTHRQRLQALALPGLDERVGDVPHRLAA